MAKGRCLLRRLFKTVGLDNLGIGLGWPMAINSITLNYTQVGDFLEAWNSSLSQGSAFIPSGTVEEEVGPKPEVYFELPLVGRAGPVEAQVAMRASDGGITLRLGSMSDEVIQQFESLVAFVASVKNYLIQSGEVAPVSAPVGDMTRGSSVANDSHTDRDRAVPRRHVLGAEAVVGVRS